MKGKIKKTLIGVAALAFAFAGVGSLATYEAKAVEPALFEMVEGASVRTSVDTSGIRFSLRVNGDQQTALSAYKSVEYGMLITQEGEATIDEIYNAGEAVFAENGDWSFDEKDIATKKFLVNITGDTLVDEKDDNGDATGNKLFNAALTNISQANYTKTYVGVGYVKTTSEGATDSADDDVVEYHFASKNKNERTITYVAEKAIAENDENAVGNAVVENYVSGGYANLGLTGAQATNVGTVNNPVLVSTDANYSALKTAIADEVVSGTSYYQIGKDVNDDNFVNDFDLANGKAKNATFEIDDNEVENFGSAESIKAAFIPTTKKTQYEGAAWLQTYKGRTGVLSLTSAGYYDDNASYAANKGGKAKTVYDGHAYYVQSSQRDGNFYATNWESDDSWNYISIWMYVQKPQDAKYESVTFGAGTYYQAPQNVPYDTWYEFVLPKTNVKTAYNNPADVFGYGNGTLKCALVTKTEGLTVYIDEISYETTTFESAITASDNYVENFASPNSVKAAYVSNNLESYDDQEYAYMQDNYEQYLNYSSGWVVVENPTFVSYKNMQNKSAQWHKAVTDNNGVTKYGVLSLNGLKTKSYGYQYAFRSTSKTSFTSTWDYISVKIFIEGETGTSVELGAGIYNQHKRSIKCGEWTEWYILKTECTKSDGCTIDCFKDAAGVFSSNPQKLSYGALIAATNNYKIYVDSISFETGTPAGATA